MNDDNNVEQIVPPNVLITTAINRMNTCLERYILTPTITNMSTTLLAMEGVAEAKGYKRPYGVNIEWHSTDERLRLFARVADVEFASLTVSRNAVINSHVDIVAALRQMADEIRGMRTHDEYRRLQWRQKLTDLVAEGEELNVGIEFVEMLRATATKLSTNIIEHTEGRTIDLT